MKIKRFEDLEVWQQARELSKVVYHITSSGPFSNDYRFRDQIRASSGSAMDNIAEGYERDGNKEFFQFLSIAKGSTGEVRSQSYRAFDCTYINQEKLDDLLERTDSLSRKIYNLMLHLKRSDINGLKYT
jgi:four helix bundle protein